MAGTTANRRRHDPYTNFKFRVTFDGKYVAGVSTLRSKASRRVPGMDLYRVELSKVVGRYIGETEKNLDRVFDAAEEAGAVLFFDEADALFGKRTRVRDSHDRYANRAIGYLLMKIESYGGGAILTTNLKNNIDEAFLRRFNSILKFSARKG